MGPAGVEAVGRTAHSLLSQGGSPQELVKATPLLCCGLVMPRVESGKGWTLRWQEAPK